MLEAFLAFAAMLGLIALRVPIAFAMGIVGYIGYGVAVDWGPALKMVTTVTYETGLSYSLSVVPLFILMGNFVSRAGLSDELYHASNAFMGHRRGGLAMATVVACGGFSAVCGSSLATAATMSKVAYPPMRRFGYSDALATGSIAAGGTLGILIPPSVILVIYGILTESDIGRLFIAGVVPGILGVCLYLVAVMITVRLSPKSGPPGERTTWQERWRALRGVWGVVLLFALVIGGIYGGVFTPTEAAGIGASGSFFFALLRRRLNLRGIFTILVESVRTTSMIFFVLIGALMFSNYINVTTLPFDLVEWVTSLDVSPLIIVLMIIAVYVVLGCVLESLSMILLTVPIFYPVLIGLDFGDFIDPDMLLIWFGIVVVVVTEISLITPPVGLNVFVLRSVLPEVKLGTIFRGVTPFWCVDIVRLVLLVLIPPLSIYLPSLMN